MMIEHLPWRGKHYSTGITGQRIAIVGHSHWGYDDDPDQNGFTQRTVCRHISGRERNSFFTCIRNYFGFESDEFWHHVVFFNYLPESVGEGDKKYRRGGRDQIERAQARFLRIIGEYRPSKVLVFSNTPGKGWQTLPPTDEERSSNAPLQTLGPEFPSFDWGTYRIGDHVAMAFGLRHPQGARSEWMQAAVQRVMAMPKI
jgi:hypothetical protein